ncbi:MAG TPA: isopentenyl-diphosphate Delta-isomerase [Candidatus Bathyarchaeia archaeon]|nr:isopentenyl-diphosphate Delta-isomerase [Candidatus Bathyarchaeia archaeon]
MAKVILVDKDDREIGHQEKLQAHRQGKLHRAFSIFIFNDRGELMLQKRAKSKYHSAGLWSNTCCSHPQPGETTPKAAHRRLKEEMGFDCPLKEVFQFCYRVDFDNGLAEHEYDHVFIGHYDGDPLPDPDEAEGWQWVGLKNLEENIRRNPDQYTYWLKFCIKRVRKLSGLV